MPRRVSSLVYWTLDAGVWMLWFGALEAVFRWGPPVERVAAGFYLGFLVADVGKAVIFERKAARREGRAALGLWALAKRPVELPSVSLNLATAHRFVMDLELNIILLLGAGWLFGRLSTEALPVVLALLVAYCAAKRLVPTLPNSDQFRSFALPDNGPAI